MDVTHTCVVTLHSPDKAILHARTDRLVAKEHGSVCLCPCSQITKRCNSHMCVALTCGEIAGVTRRTRMVSLKYSQDVSTSGETAVLT